MENGEKVKVCFTLDRRIYKDFKKACIELDATISKELERCVMERTASLKAKKRVVKGTSVDAESQAVRSE